MYVSSDVGQFYYIRCLFSLQLPKVLWFPLFCPHVCLDHSYCAIVFKMHPPTSFHSEQLPPLISGPNPLLPRYFMRLLFTAALGWQLSKESV